MAKIRCTSVEYDFKDWQIERKRICDRCPLNEDGYCSGRSCNNKPKIESIIIYDNNVCPAKHWGAHGQNSK